MVSDVLSTVMGGLFLTVILFFINEYILPKKNLTGEWKTIVTTQKSSYNKYIGLKVEYKIHLLQKGYEVIGTGEKIKEINNVQEIAYSPKERVQIDITGYYERKYIRKSKLYLNILEHGKERSSRATYELKINSIEKLDGNFISTAANSAGLVVMNKISIPFENSLTH